MKHLPDPTPGGFWLIIAPLSLAPAGPYKPSLNGPTLWDMAARLALQAGLRVLDGGNRFNAYAVAQALAEHLTRRGPGFETLETILTRVTIARAFTCYQVLELLNETLTRSIPTLALDLLATFYDENVSLAECRRLQQNCLAQIERLSAPAPLVITAHPRSARIYQERAELLDSLKAAARQVWVFDPPAPPDLQPRLPHL